MTEIARHAERLVADEQQRRHDEPDQRTRDVPGEWMHAYGSRVHRATIRLASAPGTQIATTFAPAAPVLWRTLSGGFTYPAIPGFRISLLPLTTCSSSPDPPEDRSIIHPRGRRAASPGRGRESPSASAEWRPPSSRRPWPPRCLGRSLQSPPIAPDPRPGAAWPRDTRPAPAFSAAH